MTHLFAVDVGGSAVKLGIIDEKGRVVVRDSFAFAAAIDFDGLAARTIRGLGTIAARTGLRPEAIGIATPGHADRASGVPVDGTGNVPALKNGSLPARLAEAFAMPAAIENDGVCATLGELTFGAGRGVSDFVLITVGTGIGGALVVDGRIAIGRNGKPPEIGAMVLEPESQLERNGLRGTLEELAGGQSTVRAYARQTGESPETLDVNTLRRRAIQGDRRADAAFEMMGRYIAQAFGTMINLTAIELCLVGGGISLAGDFLLERIRRHLGAYTWPYLASEARIGATQHGNDSGLIGAAAMARQHLAQDAAATGAVLYPQSAPTRTQR